MNGKMDSRQSELREAQPMIGNAANDTLDTIFPKVNDELAKIFEDRNLTLVGGGDVAVNGAATSVTFSAALALHLNSKVAGGAPTVIDLTATTRAFSADGRMLYAVIDRSLGTATVTADSATLPAVTSANQEVVLIAKRVGTDIIFRDGTKIPAGRTSVLGPNIEIIAGVGISVVQTANTATITNTSFGTPTGASLDFWGSTAPVGWVLMDGRTIGSAASGATNRANADTEDLFTLLWNSMANAEAPVSGGRGASAAADFAANKTITIPDLRGRVVAGLDNMGGSTASRITAGGAGIAGTTIGAAGGAQTHQLTTAQMPSHTHIVYGVADGGATQPTPRSLNTSNNANVTTSPTGGDQAHQNTQPTIMAFKIIKL